MENNLKEIETCEVCGNSDLLLVLDLGLHPMCDDLVLIGESRKCKEYPIEILFCKECLTAHQRFQIPKIELFPFSYHYRARFTADVLKGMAQLVNSCEIMFGNLNGKKVLDIGCNDGSLLDIFREKGAITIGIEPTDACLDAKQNGHFTYNNYFSTEVTEKILHDHGNPDFITFTNVFAHIEDLKELLRALKILIGSNTVIVIENHYLGAVFSGNQFDTFYHEHPRTYSYRSFMYIAKLLGLNIKSVEFPARYGGNIRVFLAAKSLKEFTPDSIENEVISIEGQFLEMFSCLANNVESWKFNKKREIQNLVLNYGKLKAKAFPGRAAILIKLLDLNEDSISAVYEKPGSMKIGSYIPGTRIPILSDNELVLNSEPILNLAWHISSEIHNYLTNLGYPGPIIDILNAKDFDITT